MEKHFNYRHFMFLTLSLALLAGVMFSMTLDSSKNFQYGLVAEQQKRVVEKALTVLDDALQQSKSDVLYLSKLPVLEQFSSSSDSAPRYQELQQTFLSFVSTHAHYDHLRFLNNNGQEVVRINNRKGLLEVVNDELLQNKKDRPYFVFTNSLKTGDIYISPFELNVENGAIERPERIVIRLATPVFSATGRRLGIIVANLQGDKLIGQMQAGAIAQHMQLDFYQYHQYSSSYEAINHSRQLHNDFPELFNQMLQSDENVSELLAFDNRLSSYYFFSRYGIPDVPYSDEPHTGSETVLVVSTTEDMLSENLIIPQFNPWLLSAGVGLLILLIGGGISYLRGSKEHYKKGFERQSTLLEGFVGNTPDAYIIQDNKGKIIFANQAANDLLNDGNSLAGARLDKTELYYRNPRLTTIQKRVQLEAKAEQADVEYRDRNYHINAFPIFNPGSDLTMTGCIIADQSDSMNAAVDKISSQMKLLQSIGQVQSDFMHSQDDSSSGFDILLQHFVEITESEFGFIGEVYYEEGGTPYLLTHAISDIAWNEETRAFYKEHVEKGLEFRNLDTLFGWTMVLKKEVITNDVPNDPRASGLPSGHPPINTFMGVPVFVGQKMIGMVGVANRKQGYDYELLSYIEPLIELYGQMIQFNQVRQEKQRVEMELVNQKNWLRMVLDTAPDGLLLVNAEGGIEMANQSAREMFDYSSQELIHSPVEKLIPKSHRHAHKSYRQDYIRLGMNRGYMNGRLAEALRKNGEIFPVEVHLSPIVKTDKSEEESSQDSFVICSIRDISERVEMEKQLRQSQKMDAIGQLTGGIAHDFNNLLGVIIGNLDLANLSLEESDCDGVQEAIKNAQAASNRGSKQLQRLLAFSRKQPLKPIYLHMAELMEEFLPLIKHALGSKIELHHEIAPSIASIYADEHQLENALINLAVNARDAMPDGGKCSIDIKQVVIGDSSICIGGEAIVPGEYLLIEISDSGCGIPEEHFEHIFEPFYTTKASGKGTGLGLSMVYGFIRQSNGFIQVDTNENSGSTFKLYLPVAEEVMEQHSAKAADAKPLVMAETTILLVDDEEALLKSTAARLRRTGYVVLTAKDADTALEVLSDNQVDLLFSDVIMPGSMNGIDLARHVHEHYPDIAILMGTGYASDLFEEPGAKWLKDSIIYKPYQNIELINAIDKAMSQRLLGKGRVD